MGKVVREGIGVGGSEEGRMEERWRIHVVTKISALFLLSLEVQ